MPIIFRSTPVSEPYTFESVGKTWSQDKVTRPGGFPFYHYLQTEQGTGSVCVGDKSYTLHADEGILIAPFIRHSYEKLSAEWLTRFISFNGTMANSISQMLGNRSIILIPAELGRANGKLIDSCVDLCVSHSADARTISIYCYSLLLNFTEGLHTISPEEEPLYQNYIIPVLKAIEESYYLDLTVDQLSSLVYITPQYLSRLFRRFLNCSTYEYLTSYRISRAKELLISAPLMEVQDIARSTGYTDTSHFIVVFKKLTGMTPLAFRRSN